MSNTDQFNADFTATFIAAALVMIAGDSVTVQHIASKAYDVAEALEKESAKRKGNSNGTYTH